MARFVLASSSVNRKEILERAGIEFTVIVSNADESNGPKAPDALVKELSRRKLEAVLPKCESDDLVIAADTVVYIDGEILGKPKDLTDANRFMHLLSGMCTRCLPACAWRITASAFRSVRRRR